MVDTEPVNTRFTADTTGFLRGVEQAKAKMGEFTNKARTMGRSLDNVVDQAEESANRLKIGFLGAALTASAVLAKIAVDTSKFASKASGIDEYFERSFGTFAEDAKIWAEELSEAYGIYSGEIEEFSAKLNEGFKRAGNGMSESYRMARNFTQLVYDISSLRKDLDRLDIMDWIQDLAVGGGEEALEKLLPGFDEETLKAEAYRLEIAEVGKELTVLAKQQAAYSLLMKEYGDDLGNYADGVKSSTRALTEMDGAAKDLKESLGTALTPAVTAAANAITIAIDKATEKIDAFNEKLKDSWILNGINKLAETFGDGPIFDLGVENVVNDTSSLNQMLEHVTSSAEEARKSLAGLMGFDQLNILKVGSDAETEESFNKSEEAFMQWVSLFDSEPEKAVHYLDDMWDEILDGSYDSVSDLRNQYGQYFDWLMESELANQELTQEEKEAMMAQFYDDLYNRVLEFKQREAEANTIFDEAINEARLAGDEETVKELERSHAEFIELEKELFRNGSNDAFTTLLTDFGTLSDDMAKKMDDAFSEQLAIIKTNYGTAFSELRKELEGLNALISKAEEYIANLEERADKLANSPSSSKPKSLWDNIKAEVNEWRGTGPENEFWSNQADIEMEYIRKNRGYATGGVIEPRNPALIMVGDNPREREVIAPESMIEESVIRALQKMGGSTTNRPIEINMTVELDGRQVARGIYKYTQQDSLRRGNMV